MRHEDIRQMIEDGIGLILATCDKDLNPGLSDIEAVEIAEDFQSLKVYGLSRKLQVSLAHIQQNPSVAVTISRPTDNAAVQFKGKVLSVRKTTESEDLSSKRISDQYRKEIVLVGVLPVVAEKMDLSVDTAIEVAISQVFHQTPGQKAGQNLQWKAQ